MKIFPLLFSTVLLTHLPCVSCAAESSQYQTDTRTATQVIEATLLGEIALQRNLYGDAYAAFMKAAELSLDANLAKKAHQIAEKTADTTKTAAALRLLDKIDPKNSESVLIHATQLIKEGRFDEAKRELLPAVKDLREPASYLKRLEKNTAFSKDKDARYKLFESLIHGLENNASAQIVFARAAMDAQKKDIAFARIEKALKLDSKNSTLLLEAGDIEFAHRPKVTINRLRKYLKEFPRDITIRLALARCEIRSKNVSAAIKELDTLLQFYPHEAQVQFFAGTVAEEAHEFKRARDLYMAYIRLAKDDPRYIVDAAWVRLGIIALTENKPQEAIDWLHKVEKGDKYVVAHIKEAEILDYLNRPEEACQVYRTIRTTDKTQKALFLSGCARSLSRSSQPLQALAALEDALALLSDKPLEAPHLLYEAGTLCEQLKNFNKAKDYLERYVALAPKDAQGFNSLGYLLLDDMNQVAASRPYIEKAMQLSKGGDSFIVDSYGWLLFKEGKITEAEEYVRESLRLRHDNEVQLHLVEILMTKKDWDTANRELLEVLKRDPKNEKALKFNTVIEKKSKK